MQRQPHQVSLILNWRKFAIWNPKYVKLETDRKLHLWFLHTKPLPRRNCSLTWVSPILHADPLVGGMCFPLGHLRCIYTYWPLVSTPICKWLCSIADSKLTWTTMILLPLKNYSNICERFSYFLIAFFGPSMSGICALHRAGGYKSVCSFISFDRMQQNGILIIKAFLF